MLRNWVFFASLLSPALASADPIVLQVDKTRDVRIVAKAGELIVRANSDRIVEADFSDESSTVEEKDGVILITIQKGYSEIRLPLRSNLTVESAQARIDLSGRYGTLATKSGSGDVNLTIEAAEATVSVAKGDVAFHGQSGTLKIATASGDVDIEGLCDRIDIEAPNGEIRVERPSALLEIVGGSGLVTLNGRLESSSSIGIKTTSGNVVITAGGREGMRVVATSESGEIRFPDQPTTKTKATFVRGKGGTEIRVATVSGGIRLDD